MTSYEQAKHDGVKVRFGPPRTVYEVPCEMCGEIIETYRYSSSHNYICDYCKGKNKRKKKLLIESEVQNTKTPREIQFDKAVEEIRSQVSNFGEYERAIEIARTRNERYASIPEAMVAIELIRLKYAITPQQPIGKYRVDFAIPKRKLIIEVDGNAFHSYEKDMEREGRIQLMVGLDWKIVRVPSEYIRGHIQMLQSLITAQIKSGELF